MISLLLTALVKCGMLNFKSIKFHVWNAQAKLCYEFDIEKQIFPLSLQLNILFHNLIEMLIVFVNGFASLRAWVLKQCDMMTCFSGLRDVDYVWLWGDIVDGSADVNNYRYRYLGYALIYFGVAFVVEESHTESLDGVSIVSNLLPDNTSTGDIYLASSLGHKATRRW